MVNIFPEPEVEPFESWDDLMNFCNNELAEKDSHKLLQQKYSVVLRCEKAGRPFCKTKFTLDNIGIKGPTILGRHFGDLLCTTLFSPRCCTEFLLQRPINMFEKNTARGYLFEVPELVNFFDGCSQLYLKLMYRKMDDEDKERCAKRWPTMFSITRAKKAITFKP